MALNAIPDLTYRDDKAARPPWVHEATPVFARRAYEHQHTWEPSLSVLDQISRIVFPKTGGLGMLLIAVPKWRRQSRSPNLTPLIGQMATYVFNDRTSTGEVADVSLKTSMVTIRDKHGRPRILPLGALLSVES